MSINTHIVWSGSSATTNGFKGIKYWNNKSHLLCSSKNVVISFIQWRRISAPQILNNFVAKEEKEETQCEWSFHLHCQRKFSKIAWITKMLFAFRNSRGPNAVRTNQSSIELRILPFLWSQLAHLSRGAKVNIEMAKRCVCYCTKSKNKLLVGWWAFAINTPL